MFYIFFQMTIILIIFLKILFFPPLFIYLFQKNLKIIKKKRIFKKEKKY